VSIQVQLLAQLDLVFPGLGDCFKDVLTPKSGHEGLRYCPDPVRVSRMGPDGLRAVMKTKPCRGPLRPTQSISSGGFPIHPAPSKWRYRSPREVDL